eukprot:CAMPEP_0172690370 /NCGR_PEP_ID=MMETSP1074-20121228/23809_1 /TAXON_ID=2916 /ORGANISM="Ceratium fusus, Strain PA161109" /LENGTH=79 /DNA_ID=CAMNT_0013510299 /DNA_START=393 /DNA_END=629 /DNA_ORIENTATION=-
MSPLVEYMHCPVGFAIPRSRPVADIQFLRMRKPVTFVLRGKPPRVGRWSAQVDNGMGGTCGKSLLPVPDREPKLPTSAK